MSTSNESEKAREVVLHPELPGLIEVRHALSPEWCKALIDRTEALGYNNEHHEGYQNKRMDLQEQVFRRNDRCVFQAEPELCDQLYDALKDAVPDSFEYGDYGTWHKHSVNDMFRFYRYRLLESEEESRDCFPIHKDNTTCKGATFTSWLTVLVYLSDEGFSGGGTAFYKNNALRQADAEAGPVVEVQPEVGKIAMFYHTGHQSPWHAGVQLEPPAQQPSTTTTGKTEKGRNIVGTKYVLRSDVMFEAEAMPKINIARSPPYHQTGYKYTSKLYAGQVIDCPAIRPLTPDEE